MVSGRSFCGSSAFAPIPQLIPHRSPIPATVGGTVSFSTMNSSTSRAIVPVKLSLDQGDLYTLWAPEWKEQGSLWQAFLGDNSGVFGFESPAQLLDFLESGILHDLESHPKWSEFTAKSESRVLPRKADEYDIVGLPALLADRPSYEAVNKAAGIVRIAKSLANVASAEAAVVFFASHSIVNNLNRGSEHYSGDAGAEEWTGLGSVILTNWKKVREALDEVVVTKDAPAKPDTQARIDDAVAREEAARAAEKEAAEKAAAAADPYDSSRWAAAGIDPIKIIADGRTLYSLRTYVDGRPVFLGKFGEIFTFPSGKQLTRWLVSHDDHDLAKVSTWEELSTAANAGELEVQVHDDNIYSLKGISDQILKGVDAVDTKQMARAYEIIADAADWAGDDSVNSFFLSNPRMQDYISYMLGSPETAGYVPAAPFTDHAKAWDELAATLLRRFSKN